MVRSGYSVIKDHFDSIITCRSMHDNGQSYIHDVYKQAFSVKTGLFDAYTTNISIATNPVSQFITLVGPKEKYPDMPIGIMPCMNMQNITVLTCVNVMDNQYLRGIYKYNIVDYIKYVYHAISNIIVADIAYNMACDDIYINPHCIFLRIYPIYLAYHHIASVSAPDVFTEEAIETFKQLISKFVNSNDDADLVYNSIISNNYSCDFSIIYNTITCGHTIKFKM